jgi:hypothetical protein
MIKPAKLDGKESILVPFEYSDLSGYILEFGDKYIHFYKNGLPLWETTNSEIEDFYFNSFGNEVVVTANSIYKLPGWGPMSQISGESIGDNGTVSASSGTGGTVKLTTSIPHTLRTGAKVLVRSTALPSFDYIADNTRVYTATRVDSYSIELQGTTYSAPGSGYICFFTHGLIAGDRFYINKTGTNTVPTLYNKSHIAWKVGNDGLTVTVSTPLSGTTLPTPPLTGEKGHTIPIEIVTPYSESDLADLRFVQSADVLYIMHPNYAPYKLTRLDNDGDINDWLFAKVNFEDGPYLPLNSLAPTWDESTPANGTTFSDVYFELSNYTHTADAECEYVSCTISQTSPVVPNTILVTTTSDHGLAVNDYVLISSSTVSAYNGGQKVISTPTSKTFTFTLLGTFPGNATANLYPKPFQPGAISATPRGDQSAYLEYREGDQWRLAQLPGTIATQSGKLSVTIIDNVLLYLDESVKFTGRKRTKINGRVKTVVYNAGSPNLTPTVPGAGKQSRIDPNNYIHGDVSKIYSNFSNTFGQADAGKYVRYFDSTPSPLWSQITKVAEKKPGNECNISTAVTMATNNSSGKFVITNHSRSATLHSYKNSIAFSAFKLTDVGRHVRLGFGGRWTWCKISSYISASQVSVSIYEDVPRDPHDASKLAGATGTSTTTGRTYDWRMGAWSDTTGYPSCGVFHEQRLWFGRTNTEPQTIWGSVSGDFENFSPTELDSAVLEDNAIGFTIASTKANPIKWMSSGPAIVVGTVGAEWQVKSSSVTSEPITPLNIVVVPHTGHGSNASVQPIRLGTSVLFADRPSQKIRELIYDFSVDSLVSNDITYLSEHILRDGSGAVYSAYQQEPNNLCWFVLNDGTLAAVTINKAQEIVAWHRHIIKDGLVESIAVVPNDDSTRDDVYLVINRNGTRYIELLKPDFYPASPSTRTGMRYLDSCFVNESFSGTLVYGLNHLNGKEVTVVINGTAIGKYTVSSGSITIPSQSNKELVVGLPYTSTAKSLPPEGGSMFGTSQGKIKKIAKYNVRLLNSLTLDYGFDANGQSLNSITNLHENGTSTDFYTGTKELIPNNPYDAESQWTLSTSQPYPLNILSVTMTVESGE